MLQIQWEVSTGLNTCRAWRPMTLRETAGVMWPPCSQRGNFGAAMVDDLLFVMGGYDGFRVTTKEECYDAETGSWYRTQDMCTAKKAFSCCVVPASYSIIQPHHFLMVIQEEIHPSAPNSCCNVATQWKYQA